MLYAAEPGSIWFINHIRCWAKDRGRRSGRSRASNSILAPEPAVFCATTAKPSTVEFSNSTRTGTCASSACPNLAANLVAINELPPSAKKSSSRPTRSAPNTSPNTDATISCTAVTGARNSAASNTGDGRAFRSNLPDALSGSSSRTRTFEGTMYVGSTARADSRTSDASTAVPTTYPTRLSPNVASLCRTTTASETASCEIRADSISPSSIRCPRSLTWKSDRRCTRARPDRST